MKNAIRLRRSLSCVELIIFKSCVKQITFLPSASCASQDPSHEHLRSSAQDAESLYNAEAVPARRLARQIRARNRRPSGGSSRQTSTGTLLKPSRAAFSFPTLAAQHNSLRPAVPTSSARSERNSPLGFAVSVQPNF